MSLKLQSDKDDNCETYDSVVLDWPTKMGQINKPDEMSCSQCSKSRI